MGCFSSKQQKQEALQELEVRSQEQAWQTNGKVSDVQKMEDFVRDLAELAPSFQSSSEKERIVRMCHSLKGDIEGVVSFELVLRGDVYLVQSLEHLAKEVDSIHDVGASNTLQLRLERSRREAASMEMSTLADLVKRAQGASVGQFSQMAKKIHIQLTKVDAFLSDVPVQLPQFLQHCTKFAHQIEVVLPELIESNPKEVGTLERAAQFLDQRCGLLTQGLPSGEAWEPLLPRIREKKEEVTQLKAPEKLEALEAELNKEVGMSPDKVTKLLFELQAMWVNPAPDMETKLDALLHTIRQRVMSSFDKAVEAGESGKMELLIEFAGDFDQAEENFRPDKSHGGRLKPALEAKGRQLTLTKLLEKAINSCQAAALEEAYEKCKAQVEKVNKDRFEEPAEGIRWKFKLASGGFKDYDPDKIAEVEKYYQEWLAAGKPKGKRYEVILKVAASKRTGQSRHRERCKFGEKCYRKNADHRKQFSHPGDPDWEEESNSVMSVPVATGAFLSSGSSPTVESRFSLDFSMMTQLRLDGERKAAMRIINRVPPRTVAQKLTADYFTLVAEFVKDKKTVLEKADYDLTLLGSENRAQLQEQIDTLIQKIKPVVEKFLRLAVLVRDKHGIEEVFAILGKHGGSMGIAESVKDLTLTERLEELKQFYGAETCRQSSSSSSGRLLVGGWQLLRVLCLKQKGLQPLLKIRMALEVTKRKYREHKRDRLQMLSQALLSDYAADAAFCQKFRREALEILREALIRATERYEIDVAKSILKTAVLWGCEVEPLLKASQPGATKYVRSTLRPTMQLPVVGKVLDEVADLALVARSHVSKVSDFRPLLPEMAEKVIQEIQRAKPQQIVSLVAPTVSLRSGLRQPDLAQSFDDELWQVFQPLYNQTTDSIKAADTTASVLVEWAMAYTEQIGSKMPKWMMNKDQAEALRKLKAAIESGDFNQLREAAVFAKQADYQSDTHLHQSYESCVDQLRQLRRLPTAWEVADLVGDDPAMKMFKKVDLDSANLKQLLQKLFTETKVARVTRDRAGDLPRDYQVERIQTVMNVDSWVAYLDRRDKIEEECKRFQLDVPAAPHYWKDKSGVIMSAELGNTILRASKLPETKAAANEFILLHGTKPEAAESIAQNSFDMAFACKTGLFGAGLYFAESCSKSDEYVKANKEKLYPMLVCRVALGRMFYCPNSDPTKDPGREKLERQCAAGVGDYHSVIGDRLKARGTFREFVVYNHYQVYPQFIVWYKRL